MPDEEYPEEIDFSNNHLNQNEIRPFIKHLRRKITKLNLKNNKIQALGAFDL